MVHKLNKGKNGNFIDKFLNKQLPDGHKNPLNMYIYGLYNLMLIKSFPGEINQEQYTYFLNCVKHCLGPFYREQGGNQFGRKKTSLTLTELKRDLKKVERRFSFGGQMISRMRRRPTEEFQWYITETPEETERRIERARIERERFAEMMLNRHLEEERENTHLNEEARMKTLQRRKYYLTRPKRKN
jgi:hypothetical protein